MKKKEIINNRKKENKKKINNKKKDILSDNVKKHNKNYYCCYVNNNNHNISINGEKKHKQLTKKNKQQPIKQNILNAINRNINNNNIECNENFRYNFNGIETINIINNCNNDKKYRQLTKQDIVNLICQEAIKDINNNHCINNHNNGINDNRHYCDNSFIKNESKTHFAPINIAIIKYWGKRNEELKLPTSSNLSITSSYLGTITKIKRKARITETTAEEKLYQNNQQNERLQKNEQQQSQNFSKKRYDDVFLNGKIADKNFTSKVVNFINLFRNAFHVENVFFTIETHNNFPMASGLASSASGFGALTLAINDIFNINLSQKELSILARLGSGSASRSVIFNNNEDTATQSRYLAHNFLEQENLARNHHSLQITDNNCHNKIQFAIWHKGKLKNGMDSYAERISFGKVNNVSFNESDVNYINTANNVKDIYSNKNNDYYNKNCLRNSKQSKHWIDNFSTSQTAIPHIKIINGIKNKNINNSEIDIEHKTNKNVNNSRTSNIMRKTKTNAISKIAENLGVLILKLSSSKKHTSSTKAMHMTMKKSKKYKQWLKQTKKDIINIFNVKIFAEFGEIIENNSLMMHDAIREIGINYFNNRTKKVIQFVKKYRKNGLQIYLTIDAGANVIVLFQKHDKRKIIDLLLNNKIVKKDEILNF